MAATRPAHLQKSNPTLNSGRHLLVCLTVLTLLHVLGAALFASGFLLTRTELVDSSTCTDVPVDSSSTCATAATCETACWSPSLTKAVVLLIDGLRWDVAAGTARSAAPHRSLALPSLQNLSSDPGRSTILARFVADPPTTTQQRLKGLLTGGLPTFVDVGASFGAPALREDNLVRQLAVHGRRLAVLGDDTWMQLFPDAATFAMAHPFPSFDVQDLYTVDDGVKRHMTELLQRPDEWDVLVAHFLGVDHAGHTFSMDSDPMAAKLAEMDKVISETVAQLASHPAYNSTLFLVIGDHGMTWKGDHGGATPEEVDSALFATMATRNSATGSPASSTAAHFSLTLPQIDFAPTMALLFGVPIPFGSIGRLSQQLWSLADGKQTRYAAALHANARQVHRAMDAYGAAGAFAASDVDMLDALFRGSSHSVTGSEAFLEAAARVARAQWTQFDALSMAAGIAVMCLALGLHRAALSSQLVSSASSGQLRTSAILACVCAGVHACGDFSVAFMKEEHQMGHALMIAITFLNTCYAVLHRSHICSSCIILCCSIAIWAVSMTGEYKATHTDHTCSTSWFTPACALNAARMALSIYIPLLMLPLSILYTGKTRSISSVGAGLSFCSFLAVALRWLSPAHCELALIILPRLVYMLTVANLALACSGRAVAGSQSQAHVLNSAARHLLAALSPLLLMLTGRPSALIALLTAGQLAVILAALPHESRTVDKLVGAPSESSESIPQGSHTPWQGVWIACVLHATSKQLFSATGHRSSFDALHFAAAFTGFSRFNFARQGTLLALNTWANELVTAALVPLFAGAIAHNGDAPVLWRSLGVVTLTRSALSAMDATASVVAAAALRRHLHVWSHFAPKFVFQTLAMLVVDTLLLIPTAALLTTLSWRRSPAE